MIIARGKMEGDELLMLGLSHQNVRRLLSGEPIHIHRSSHGDGIPKGWRILICAGETEKSIESDFRKAGVVDEATPRIVERRLGKDNEH